MKPVFMVCKNCNTTIYSQYSGHFVACTCRHCMIDQTNYYARYIGDPKQYTVIDKIEYYDIIDWWYKYCSIKWDNSLKSISNMNFNNTCCHLNYPFILENKTPKYLYQFMLQVTQDKYCCYKTDDNKYFVYVTVCKIDDKKFKFTLAGCDDSIYTKHVSSLAKVVDTIKSLTTFSEFAITPELGWFHV